MVDGWWVLPCLNHILIGRDLPFGVLGPMIVPIVRVAVQLMILIGVVVLGS